MNRVRTFLLLSAAALAMAPEPARAQAAAPSPTDKVYVNVDFGMQIQSQTFSTAGSLSLYDETATYSTTLKAQNAGFVDISGGARLWRDLFVGAAYTQRLKTTGDAALDASLPHPLFFDSPRNVTSTASGLQNREMAVHISVGWRVPITPRFDLRVFGGPSFFTVKQDVVQSLSVAETGAPFTTATIDRATAAQVDASAAGFHIGADASVMFTQNVGIGVLIRYAAATVDLKMADGQTAPIDAGGFAAGAGARIRF